MIWLERLSEDEHNKAVITSQKKRRHVESTVREDEKRLCDQRIKKMVEGKKKADEKEEIRQTEIEKLRSIPIIDTISNLQKKLIKWIMINQFQYQEEKRRS